jgi:hypothetical protein
VLIVAIAGLTVKIYVVEFVVIDVYVTVISDDVIPLTAKLLGAVGIVKYETEGVLETDVILFCVAVILMLYKVPVANPVITVGDDVAAILELPPTDGDIAIAYVIVGVDSCVGSVKDTVADVSPALTTLTPVGASNIVEYIICVATEFPLAFTAYKLIVYDVPPAKLLSEIGVADTVIKLP